MKLHTIEKVEGDTRFVSYLLQRKGGNILFNPVDDEKVLRNKVGLFDSIGGVKWIFLTHGEDACPASKYIHNQFGATLYGHDVWDADKAKVRSKVPIGSKFSGGHVFEKDVEVIEATGHCPYFHAFRFKANGKKYLLTSDMLEGRENGKWAVNIPERLSKQGFQSIQKLFDLEFDYLCPSFSNTEWMLPIPMNKAIRKEFKEMFLSILVKKHKMKTEIKTA